jgi:hypothetical protein
MRQSDDNLYGGWEGVNGLKNADAAHTTEVDQSGVAYGCLRHDDINLAAMAATCTDAAHGIRTARTTSSSTTRIPALIIAPGLNGDFVVDSKEQDAILATIEHRYGLAPLATRDAAVNDLTSIWSAKVVTK